MILYILVVQHSEFKQKVDEVLDVRERQKEALHYFWGLVRQIKASDAEIEVTPFTSLLFSRMQKIIHIIGHQVKASVEKLHKAIGLFQWILERFFTQKTAKTTYTCVASDIHIEHTIPKQDCNGNKNVCSDHSEDSQMTHVIFGRGKREGESVEKGKMIFLIKKITNYK